MALALQEQELVGQLLCAGQVLGIRAMDSPAAASRFLHSSTRWFTAQAARPSSHGLAILQDMRSRVRRSMRQLPQLQLRGGGKRVLAVITASGDWRIARDGGEEKAVYALYADWPQKSRLVCSGGDGGDGGDDAATEFVLAFVSDDGTRAVAPLLCANVMARERRRVSAILQQYGASRKVRFISARVADALDVISTPRKSWFYRKFVANATAAALVKLATGTVVAQLGAELAHTNVALQLLAAMGVAAVAAGAAAKLGPMLLPLVDGMHGDVPAPRDAGSVTEAVKRRMWEDDDNDDEEE